MAKLESFNFFIGGFGGDCDRVCLEDNILYQDSPMHEDELRQPFIEGLKLTDDQIYLFWKRLDELDIWNWSKEYNDPDTLDGTQWSLKINKQGGKKLKIYGSNAYPNNFDDLLRLLNGYIEEKLYK